MPAALKMRGIPGLPEPSAASLAPRPITAGPQAFLKTVPGLPRRPPRLHWTCFPVSRCQSPWGQEGSRAPPLSPGRPEL